MFVVYNLFNISICAIQMKIWGLVECHFKNVILKIYSWRFCDV